MRWSKQTWVIATFLVLWKVEEVRPLNQVTALSL
ncbi:unnamed protein product [Brassica napus]|uniref:(rape) hypothetical protein n=1 Tax=Brassica napus TaxID=3708 RepID=A0A816LW70_BRANA|nr:unnamed protein product [Brassica napus]